MPQSQDPTIVETGTKLVEGLKGAFHTPPGYRPAHAKGLLLTGTFTPTPLASQLSSAPHFTRPSTEIIARFSNSTGIPQIPDTDANSNPRGLAVRFMYGQRQHTDIISHSTPFFPVRTGQEFLEFLGALGGGTILQFLETHEGAKKFVEAAKPFPEGFELQKYFGLNAFKLVNGDGKITVVRYEFHPFSSEEVFLKDEEVKDKGENYLYDTLRQTVGGGGGVKMKLVVQIGEHGDPTNDITLKWPETRKRVELGVIELNEVKEDRELEKNIIFDPIPRVEGVEPSDDPLLEMRASLYLTSGRQRRAAPSEKKGEVDGGANGVLQAH
ncbi:hypothetical protein I302_105391 [Kwoniella bestiolae CBS 10118]|uniref:Catalase core domain-containing protein n=1 Tax=Kwoniella bestiolae CBS 10118 TaxID=1296100 RepID=A0A1B9FT02_9TREE|nr:hypothetical protein I302_08672 [Kwoniella bestiolae CBS 10118]OCF21893.1 hypothetical protein I302_08672 [Kwoniella bestiolae CBS 10118]